jgi:hypothetical protein
MEIMIIIVCNTDHKMEGLAEILKLVGAIATIPDKVQDNAEQVSSRYAMQMSGFVVAALIDTPASSACLTCSARLWLSKLAFWDTTWKKSAEATSGIT